MSTSDRGGASVSSGGTNKRKRSWSRAVFSNLQRKGLEKRFQLQKYITKPDRRQLAATLGLTDAQVCVISTTLSLWNYQGCSAGLIFGLTKLHQLHNVYSVSWEGSRLMNWEFCRMKWSRSILRSHSSVCLQGPRKRMEPLVQIGLLVIHMIF
jgi:hypothetical protein